MNAERMERITLGKTEAKLWRQRLMGAPSRDDFEVQRSSMMAAVVEHQRLDEDTKGRLMSLPIVGPAAAIKDSKWTDDAEALIFADKSALVMGLLDEEKGGLHVIAVREWISYEKVMNNESLEMEIEDAVRFTRIEKKRRREPMPLILVADVRGTSGAEPGPELVTSYFDSLDEFEKAALANGEEQALEQVRAALAEKPNEMPVLLLYNGGHDVKTVIRVEGERPSNESMKCTCGGGDEELDLEYIKIGKLEFGICRAHRVYRDYGWNNISSHWLMTLNQMRQGAISVHGFESLNDPPGTCVWDAAIAAKAVEEWFEPFFQSAMRANPSLTREQLADMPIEEMVLDDAR